MNMQTSRAAPYDESYVAQFSALVAEIAHNGKSPEAAHLVQDIANRTATEQAKRSPIPLPRWAAIYARDSYTCRYCGRHTIALPVLRVVSHLFSADFLFHENWKASETDAAYLLISTSGDYIRPVTRGGTNDLSNLVTACARCNYTKENYLLEELPRWELLPPAATSWRGLTQYLQPMLEATGLQNVPYFMPWVKALQSAEAPEPERLVAKIGQR